MTSRAVYVWFHIESMMVIIYFDSAEAFDTVSHSELLLKLGANGIKGDLYRWIDAFLSNRTQKVIINDNYSEEKPIISGAPQGSVLDYYYF